MNPERTNAAQLPLPFQPSSIVQMTQEDRIAVLNALAQLLLSASEPRSEETRDEH